METKHFIVCLYDWSFDHHENKRDFFNGRLNLDSRLELRDNGITFIRNNFYDMESGVTFHVMASCTEEAIRKVITYINCNQFPILNSYKSLLDSDFVAIEY